jgi:hypothetical protein
MDGIEEAECRSIFLDWVLGLPEGSDVAAESSALLARAPSDDHPMTRILREATATAENPRRRGGRRRLSGEAPPPPTQVR